MNGRMHTALRAAGRACVTGLATLLWAVLWAATSPQLSEGGGAGAARSGGRARSIAGARSASRT